MIDPSASHASPSPTSRIQADSPREPQAVDPQRDVAAPRRRQHRSVRDRRRFQHDIRRQRGHLPLTPSFIAHVKQRSWQQRESLHRDDALRVDQHR